MVPWPPSRGTYSKEVPEGGQEIYFWGKEKSQVSLAALESWASLGEAASSGRLPGTRPWQDLRQAEVADTGFAQSSPRVARESWGWRSSHCRA